MCHTQCDASSMHGYEQHAWVGEQPAMLPEVGGMPMTTQRECKPWANGGATRTADAISGGQSMRGDAYV